MHFVEWKVLNFDSNFTEVSSQGSNWQYVSIGSGNGLAPNRRQAITWTKAYLVHRRIYATLWGLGRWVNEWVNFTHLIPRTEYCRIPGWCPGYARGQSRTMPKHFFLSIVLNINLVLYQRLNSPLMCKWNVQLLRFSVWADWHSFPSLRCDIMLIIVILIHFLKRLIVWPKPSLYNRVCIIGFM